MNFFRRLWAKLFFKKPVPQIENKPEETAPAPSPAPAPETTQTSEERQKDTVNDGSPRAPDFTYLFDNLVVDANRLDEARKVCERIVTNARRYRIIANSIGCPWWLVSLYHYREDSSMGYDTCLHNGEAIIGTRLKTKLVPAGRGPFATWEDAAIDALKLKGYHKETDWSLGPTLARVERFNGLGYRKKVGDSGDVEYSPYLVAGSTFHDETGKFVKDGKYSPTAKEKQLGTFTILRVLVDEFGVKI